MARSIRYDTDILHTRGDSLSESQRKAKDLSKAIVRLALLGKGMIEGKDASFKKRQEDGTLVDAEPKGWNEKVAALTFHLLAMDGGQRELEFVMNRWSKVDDREDLQLIWSHAVIDERTKMNCPFAVSTSSGKGKKPYGWPTRSTPKTACKRVLTFIAGRNHPAREAKFKIAAAAFKREGWATDEQIAKCWANGEKELKEHLQGRGRSARKGMSS